MTIPELVFEQFLGCSKGLESYGGGLETGNGRKLERNGD